MALNLPAAFWLLIALTALLLLGLAFLRRLRWWPAWPLRFILTSLALLVVFYPRPEPRLAEVAPEKQVLVIDFSDSVLPAERTALAQAAATWQKAQAGRVVVGAAAQAAVLLDPAVGALALDGRASDLAGGLELAAKLLGDQPGRIFLASDGKAANPAVVKTALEQLTRQGRPVEIIQLAGRDSSTDGYLGALQAPASLWEGVPFDVVVPVFPPDGGKLEKLTLSINGQASQAQAAALEPGLYRIPVAAQQKGVVTLDVAADFSLANGSPDEFSQNNHAYATLQVFAAPKVLFVTDDPQRDDPMLAVLKRSGLAFDVIQPQKLSTRLEDLGKYQVILLSNFLSSLLTDEQMISLQVFVSNQAGGLIFLGGRNSYSLGGYKGSLLEPLLPVKLEPPPRPQRPPIVFMLLMDSSGSMGTGEAVLPITLAKEAAMRAVENLKAQDTIGMEAFSEVPGWVTRLRPLGDGLALRQVLDQISIVDSGGGTRMYYAMEDALKGLADLPAGAPASRHVLILSDGDSADGDPASFAALARQFYSDQHATVSTIALGDNIKKDIMASIAAEGKGRFYVAKTPADLPKIMIAESQAGRAENIQTGQCVLKAGIPDHPLLSGLSEKDLPVLTGYNAQASKKDDGAEDILVSGQYADPILSAWQYGLGRVVAWMSDAGEEWRGAWADPARETSFWLQVIRYSLPNPAIGPAQADVKLSDSGMTVTARLQNGAGQPLDLAQVVFSYSGSDGKLLSLSIPQAAPGVYRLEAARPTPGAYRGLVSFQSGGQDRQEIAMPFTVNAPAEWLPDSVGVGPANLAEWAKISGTALAQPGALQAATSPSVPEKEQAAAGPDWYGYLLIALVLLWPLEIALRRRWLSWH
jgi:uncharacterized membrane protein